MRTLNAAFVLAALLAGCSSSPPVALDMATAPDLGYVQSPLIAARPYQSHVPDSYDPTKPTPLVVLLHGYSASGFLQDAYFGLTAVSDSSGFLYAYPDGLKDSLGNRYWNATDSCCNFDHTNVDDVQYLNAVVDDMAAQYNVDAKRIYFIGHSNGGFMTYRMACESGSRIAGVVVLAGAMWLDTSKCPAKDKVPVLHVHGTADAVIAYDGVSMTGGALAPFPGAKVSLADWATTDGCGPLVDTSETEPIVSGLTTNVSRHSCPTGIGAELWSINLGSHTPAFISPAWPKGITDWLFQFHKP